jgi:DNA-binding PadR family transcriptional regulator
VLGDAAYRTLAALHDGPLHGYAIAKRVQEQSDGQVRLATGTLYGVLERLQEGGLVAAGAEEIVDGRARRAYALTEVGREALFAEAARLRAASELVPAAVLRARPA